MVRLFLLGGGLILALATPAWTQIRNFPYEGLVESNEAYVRSGPGNQFYPTLHLKRGARVTVHRHDPGGWYMISPPAGSFSWIRAEYVKKTAPNRGLITANNVVVRVGSGFGDETREVEQVRLSTNDQVELLEEKVLATSAGPVPHYKIVPPAGEYRWIAGKSVTPVNQIVRQQQDQNPFATPSQAKQPNPAKAGNVASAHRTSETPGSLANNQNAFEPPTTQPTGDAGARRIAPDPAVLAAQRQRLDELDNQFREMVNGRTSDWKFTPLEQGYRQLQQQAALPAIASQIDLRYAAIERYRQLKREYDELVRLTTETRERDARLASVREEQPNASGSEPTSPKIEPVPDPVDLPGVEPMDQNPQAQPTPTPAEPTPTAPQSQNVRRVPRFDGAGIIQSAAATGAGTPAFVLITPQGRVLAYLQAVPGLDLNRYVGQAMGLSGERTYRSDLRTDFILVRSLTPVRLAP